MFSSPASQNSVNKAWVAWHWDSTTATAGDPLPLPRRTNDLGQGQGQVPTWRHTVCMPRSWIRTIPLESCTGCCLLLYVSAQTSGWARFFGQQCTEWQGSSGRLSQQSSRLKLLRSELGAWKLAGHFFKLLVGLVFLLKILHSSYPPGL